MATVPVTPEQLATRQNEEVTPARFAELRKEVDRLRALQSGDVRHAFPWGMHRKSARGSGGAYVSNVFAPTVKSVAAGFAVSWQRGTIGGVEPSIGGVAISGDRKNKVKAPAFIVGKNSFGPTGQALVYFELILSTSWNILKIEPAVYSSYPDDESWKARVLALVIYQNGGNWRRLHAGLSWLAVNRKLNGRAIHLFWSVL